MLQNFPGGATTSAMDLSSACSRAGQLGRMNSGCRYLHANQSSLLKLYHFLSKNTILPIIFAEKNKKVRQRKKFEWINIVSRKYYWVALKIHALGLIGWNVQAGLIAWWVKTGPFFKKCITYVYKRRKALHQNVQSVPYHEKDSHFEYFHI